MNKTEVITEIAARTGINPTDCTSVLDSFEEILAGELDRKGWKNGLFEIVFSIMNRVKNKKNASRAIN